MKIKPGFSADMGIMTFYVCASYSVNKLATLTQALTTLDSLSAQHLEQSKCTNTAYNYRVDHLWEFTKP